MSATEKQQLKSGTQTSAAIVEEALERASLPDPSSGPLAGTVIADFSRVLAGPYCTMLLADMGATVIKVESPSGDDTRHWKPPVHDDESTYYLSINRNKHSIVLDLNKEEDLDTAYRLLDLSDVFVDNFRPGSLERFGLDPESVAKRWPDIVHSSITGFGTAGGKHLPGYDLLVQGLSGFMSITGDTNGPPQRAGMAIFDVMTGLHTAIGILAALQHRFKTNEGQHVATNLLSSAISGLANVPAGQMMTGETPPRMGTEIESLYPYGPFETGEGQLIIAIGNDNQFRTFAEIVDRPELSTDERFSTVRGRNQNRTELRSILLEILSQKSARQWHKILQASGLPCAPILDIGEGIEFADSIGLEPVAEVGEGARKIPTVSNPITFSETPVRYDHRPPGLGKDREAILKWLDERSIGNAVKDSNSGDQ